MCLGINEVSIVSKETTEISNERHIYSLLNPRISSTPLPSSLQNETTCSDHSWLLTGGVWWSVLRCSLLAYPLRYLKWNILQAASMKKIHERHCLYLSTKSIWWHFFQVLEEPGCQEELWLPVRARSLTLILNTAQTGGIQIPTHKVTKTADNLRYNSSVEAWWECLSWWGYCWGKQTRKSEGCLDGFYKFPYTKALIQ